jgi:hypothetical protein
MDKDEDIIVISGSSDVTLDISDYGAAQATCAIDSIDLSGITLTNTGIGATVGGVVPTSYTIGSGGTNYTWADTSYTTSYTFAPNDASVNINTDGVEIKDGGDLKIGDRSMKEFMDRVEDQLAILRPAPELEEKWNKLKELRRQYEECKQDILEKEKIMKILKEQ